MVDLVLVCVFEFAIAATGLVTAGIPLLKRYLERKTRVTLFLLLTFYFLIGAIFVAGVGRIVRMVLWVPSSTSNIEFNAISVLLVAISDVFLLAFTLDVFYEGATAGKNKLVLILYSLCAAAYITYDLATGLYLEDLNEVIWLLVIILSVSVALVLIRSATKLSRKVEDPVAKWGLRLMAVGPVCLIGTYALFMVDAAFGGKFTPFYFAGWIVAIFAILFVYIGFIQPDWFKKRFQRKSKG